MTNDLFDYLLVVEDSDVDYDILESVMNRNHPTIKIRRQSSGESALAFLREALTEDAKLPGVVLLDFNLIGINGIEVIKAIRSDSRMVGLPIVILSTSKSPKDAWEAYASGASTYLCKPLRLEAFEELLKTFVEYWFNKAFLVNHSPLQRSKLAL